MFSRNDPNAASNQGFGGYLMKLKRKQNALLSQWNNRWFSVQGSTLKWYSSKESTEPSGSVDLGQVTAISEFENGTSGSFSFVIRCSQRNMLLRASSTADMEKWIRILRQQASFAQGGNGTSIVLSNNMILGDKEKNKKNGSSSLATELDRALNQLDQLESDSCKESESEFESEFESNHRETKTTKTDSKPVPVVITNRNTCGIGLGLNDHHNPHHRNKIPSPVGTGSGSDFIRSSDSEITIGKMHVANQGYGSTNAAHHYSDNVSLTDDREIAIRTKDKEHHHQTPSKVSNEYHLHSPTSPFGQGHNDSAILHYTEEDNDEDDAVQEFSMIQDDDDIEYIERLQRDIKNPKCDYINQPSGANINNASNSFNRNNNSDAKEYYNNRHK